MEHCMAPSSWKDNPTCVASFPVWVEDVWSHKEEVTIRLSTSILKLREKVSAKFGISPQNSLLSLHEARLFPWEIDEQGRRGKERFCADYGLHEKCVLRLTDYSTLLPRRCKATGERSQRQPCRIEREELRGVTASQYQQVCDFVEHNCHMWQDQRIRLVLLGKWMTVTQVAEWVMKPATLESACSMVEIIAGNANAQWPKWYVTHWWGQHFFSLRRCLEKHIMARRLARSTPYWICAFARNLNKSIDPKAGCSMIRKALRQCDGLLLALESLGAALVRTWCLYELFAAIDLSSEQVRSTLLLDLSCSCEPPSPKMTSLEEVGTRCSERGRRVSQMQRYDSIEDDAMDELETPSNPLRAESLTRAMEEWEAVKETALTMMTNFSTHNQTVSAVITHGLSRYEEELEGTHGMCSGWQLKLDREESFPLGLVEQFIGPKLDLSSSGAFDADGKRRLLCLLSRRRFEDDESLVADSSLEAISKRIRSALAEVCWTAAAHHYTAKCHAEDETDKSAKAMPSGMLSALADDPAKRTLRLCLVRGGPCDLRLPEIVRALPGNLSDLELLIADHSGQSGEGCLEILAEALPEGLERLSLDLRWAHDLGEGGLCIVAKAIAGRLRKLRTLELKLHERCSEDTSLQQLAQALPADLSTLEIDASKGQSAHFGDTCVSDVGLGVLADALPRGLVSLTLNLSNTAVTDAGILKLAQVLPQSVCGLKLKLRGTVVSDEVRYSASSLTCMRQMQQEYFTAAAQIPAARPVPPGNQRTCIAKAFLLPESAAARSGVSTCRLASSCQRFGRLRRTDMADSPSPTDQVSHGEGLEDDDGGGGAWHISFQQMKRSVTAAARKITLTQDLQARSTAERYVADLVQICLQRMQDTKIEVQLPSKTSSHLDENAEEFEVSKIRLHGEIVHPCRPPSAARPSQRRGTASSIIRRPVSAATAKRAGRTFAAENHLAEATLLASADVSCVKMPYSIAAPPRAKRPGSAPPRTAVFCSPEEALAAAARRSAKSFAAGASPTSSDTIRPQSARSDHVFAIARMSKAGIASEALRPAAVPADADVRRKMAHLRVKSRLSPDSGAAYEPSDLPQGVTNRSPMSDSAGLVQQVQELCRVMTGQEEVDGKLIKAPLKATRTWSVFAGSDFLRVKDEGLAENYADGAISPSPSYASRSRVGQVGRGAHDQLLHLPSHAKFSRESELATELSQLAKELNMPMQELLLAKSVFTAIDADASGYLDAEEMSCAVQELISMTSQSDEDMLHHMKEQLDKVFRNWNNCPNWTWRGFVDFYWKCAQKGFLVSEEQVLVNIAKKYSARVDFIVHLKRCYDEFLVQGSTMLEEDGFRKFLSKVLKAPANAEFPETRVKRLWLQLTSSTSGTGSAFEELVAWWLKTFGERAGEQGLRQTCQSAGAANKSAKDGDKCTHKPISVLSNRNDDDDVQPPSADLYYKTVRRTDVRFLDPPAEPIQPITNPSASQRSGRQLWIEAAKSLKLSRLLSQILNDAKQEQEDRLAEEAKKKRADKVPQRQQSRRGGIFEHADSIHAISARLKPEGDSADAHHQQEERLAEETKKKRPDQVRKWQHIRRGGISVPKETLQAVSKGELRRKATISLQ
eukprot:TRINITY_DN2804_c0_g1_i1.p1 TRINITY_DN2804_c0_g1~~TRINITY_DN2804_c0_g1_i1.p1  ORF type:complete len:1626 (+),score=284.61 TRINITY_DN2804_c0_g1_i1:58-4878(+)